jgi:predicted Zn-dependent protease
MFTREQAKAIVDKVIDMATADAVEVELTGGERSGTRWANSSITTNLVQYDQEVTVTVRQGQKTGNASTRDFTDEGFRAMVDEAQKAAAEAEDSERELPELLGPQEYIPVDATLPDLVNFGPAERGRMVKDSLDISERMGVLGAGYIPKIDQATCNANSKGLFAYYRVAETGFVLTCRLPDGSGSGWAGITGVKDLSMIDAKALTEVASSKAVRSRAPRAVEPGRYTVILEPRANARFLSLMTGIFNAAPAREGDDEEGGGGPGGGGGGGGGGFGGVGANARTFMADKNPGDKLFSDLFTLKSEIGHPVLRQTPIMNDHKPAAPVTWVENGVFRNFSRDQPATPNMSLVMEGSELSIEEMIAQTRRGLLVTFFWYIRGVPSETQALLNTGMTRDGLFLIENGEIVGPVQNFRWNMSPLVGYNNLSLVGKPVLMHMGESYDGGNTALIPPVRIEEFYMTSISPAVAP